MLSVGRLKNFRKETKFLSDKMAEKSRFRELSTDEIQKMLENATLAPTKKATNFGLKFPYKFKEIIILPYL